MTPTELTMTTWDGAKLFYRAWLPAKPATRAVLLFHRGHEHSGRWQETIDGLALEDTAFFAWDARGHGRSDGERGSAENLAVMIKDVDAFVRDVSRAHGISVSDILILAHSVGAVLATAWVHDYAPPIRGLILATPAFRVKLYVPFAVPALRLKHATIGGGYVKSYVKAKMLTHDPAEAAAYEADPLIFRQIAVNILLDLHDTSARLVADAGAITTPTLILAAGSDWVVQLGAQRTFFERLSSPVKEMEVFDGFGHAIFHEQERARVFARCRRFIEERFAQPAAEISLLKADEGGFTKSEYDRLRGPGSPIFALTRGFMKTIGQLSEGIRLGWRTGFDSGSTLDYVYENNPRGLSLLGRMIDANYLGSVGWSGIRQRRVHLEMLLTAVIEETHAAGQPVRIVDLACGGARYVLATLAKLGDIPASAVLRDYKEENLAVARVLAHDLGLRHISFERADAFERASVAAIQPRPTIGIVSGLFELFPSNAPVRTALAGLAEAIAPGGHLLYTNQPWHPQVEFIARVLTNREGEPWIMRRRTQAEMDQLVRAAGFEKLREEIDASGIFSVSVARRIAG